MIHAPIKTDLSAVLVGLEQLIPSAAWHHVRLEVPLLPERITSLNGAALNAYNFGISRVPTHLVLCDPGFEVRLWFSGAVLIEVYEKPRSLLDEIAPTLDRITAIPAVREHLEALMVRLCGPTINARRTSLLLSPVESRLELRLNECWRTAKQSAIEGSERLKRLALSLGTDLPLLEPPSATFHTVGAGAVVLEYLPPPADWPPNPTFNQTRDLVATGEADGFHQ